jgi:hypothetical protein
LDFAFGLGLNDMHPDPARTTAAAAATTMEIREK